MAKFLSTADLDADTLKANFKTYLAAQDRFKDYNFEGSNFAVLLDVMNQNTMYNNHYLNMMGAESYLDSAELRESIVSRAKELNYVPKSKTSARAKISVEVFPTDSPNSILIPKGYKFKSRINNVTYFFSTRQNYKIVKSNDRYLIEDVEIFEGEPVVEYYDLTSVTSAGVVTYTSNITIASENVDTTSIEVVVDGTTYTKAESLRNLNSSSKVYFIQGYKGYQYEIVFGDGILGKSVDSGTTVQVSYADTIGEDANGISAFAYTEAISGYSSITVITETTSYGGSNAESNENIKFNAPRHYQTQGNAVIQDDYKNLVLTNFPEIQAVNAYGGEEDLLYGKVIISLKPYNATNISDSLKSRIKSYLDKRNLTTESIIKDLEYFYVKVTTSVNYAANDTTETSASLKSAIITNILALNDTSFNKFNQSVYSSNLSAIIDNTDDSILSNSLFLEIGKRITPTIDTITAINIQFGNLLESSDSISSDTFTYTHNDTDYEAWIQDLNGVLGVYTTNTSGTVVLLENVGTVDYTTGECVLSISIAAYSDYITIFAKTVSRDIEVTKNKFIILDSADFTINMVANA